ncbi:MAG TPA: pyridoxal phosphate-dependent aminotransferase [Candidatus Aminicenantes bacterium]|mgnify:CR=1 FL=1|nr:pyridoxal phosphate-dependent aminotransferase [Candidatus Aminicenantes bacterium]
MNLSQRARDIQESPIRKLSAPANAAKALGIRVYHLNIGQPDIPTPEAFFEGIRNYAEPVLAYGPSDGLPELRRTMVNYFARFDIALTPDQIIITTGGSEAVSFAINAVADPGDEVIVPEPFYTNYNGYSSLSGIRIVPVTTAAECGFHLPDPEQIESLITPKTRAILICSPNNPTGTVFTENEIRTLGDLARRHNLFLIADEVYKEFTYEGTRHFSILELEDLEDRAIVLDSISKRYSACGARIGAVMCRNPEIMGAIMKFAQARLCPPTLEQVGAVAAYALPKNYFDSIRAEYQKRRDILVETLTSNPDILLHKPEGAFYVMATLPVDDSDLFARWMLESFNHENETVMMAPGAGFYSSVGKGRQEVRLAYVLETSRLRRACEVLLEGVEEYNKKS